jgi:hypothetical protein
VIGRDPVVALYVIAGYVLLGGFGTRAPLTQICARVDYLNSLQEELRDPLSEEMQTELAMLVEQCGAALKDHAGESEE